MHAHVHVEVVVCKDSLLYVYVVTVFGINDDIALTKLLSLLHVLFSLLSVRIYNQCGGMQCHQSNLRP